MKDYPHTFSMYENEISLPVYFTLSDEQVETVIRAVVESVQQELGQPA
jgi:dTDP-4-amino-4,6-dideoxygalactose transaminase